jgi:hypothetical protein
MPDKADGNNVINKGKVAKQARKAADISIKGIKRS